MSEQQAAVTTSEATSETSNDLPPGSDAESVVASEAAANEGIQPEAPAEPAKEPTGEEQVAEKKAARLALLARKEQALQRKREETKRARLEIDQQRAQLERMRAEIEADRARVQRAIQDPVNGWKDLGHDPAKVYEQQTRAILEANTPEAKMRVLEEQLLAERQERQKWVEEQKSAQQRNAFESAQKAFIGGIEAKADRYPHLIEYEPREVFALAHEVVNEYVKLTGSAFTGSDDELAEALELRAAAVAKARQERRQRLGARLSESGPQAAAGNGPQATRPNAPRTLTNGQSSQRASAPRQMTEEELDRQLKAELKAALSGNR